MIFQPTTYTKLTGATAPLNMDDLKKVSRWPIFFKKVPFLKDINFCLLLFVVESELVVFLKRPIRKLAVTGVGVSREIFRVLFWPVWIDLGLHKNIWL